MDKKKCTGCGKRKLLSEFGLDRGHVKSTCRRCDCKRAKEYAAKNSEKVRAAQKAAYWRDRDKRRLRSRTYYWAHRDESIKAATEWAQTHKKRRRAYMRGYYKKYANGEREHKERNEKKCTHCGEVKSTSDFNKNRYVPDGLQSECKVCKSERGKEYTAKNKERIHKQYKIYAKKNKEKLRIRAAAYRKTHKDASNAHTHKHRSQIRGNGGKFTTSQWKMLVSYYSPNGRCLSCGRVAKPSIDHVIPVSVGGINEIGNLQPICLSCNSRKHDDHIDYRPDKGKYARSLRG